MGRRETLGVQIDVVQAAQLTEEWEGRVVARDAANTEGSQDGAGGARNSVAT